MKGSARSVVAGAAAWVCACTHAAPLAALAAQPAAAPSAEAVQPAAPLAATTAQPAASAAAPPLFDTLGNWHHAVSTKNPRAQAYFDQGLRLIYGFNHDEAIKDFKEAARLDPDCAMAYWGVALALGPNINLPTDPEREALAFEMVEKARAHQHQASPAEQGYVAAIASRYSRPQGAATTAQPDRAALDRAYVGSMRALSSAFPDDADAAVLFAESLMDLRPWHFWTNAGQPEPGTEELIGVLEAVLRKHPDHPGANHYYIHAVEASPTPQRALQAAARLPGLMPGAGHLVHMPSHIFMHTGQYAEASASNRDAIAADREYLAIAKPEGFYPMMYVAHNYQFLSASASMEGRSKDALQAAQDMVARFPPEMIKAMESQMPGVDFFLAPPYFAMARFGKWDELIAAPAPADEFPFLREAWRYARGLALLRKGRLEEAAEASRRLTLFARQCKPELMLGNNQAKSIFLVASYSLMGELSLARGDAKRGLHQIDQAVALEDELAYDEPPPWYQPVRQQLGAALLRSGNPKAAEEAFRADLKRNPENGWSLFGLAQALRARKSPEAAKVQQRFAKAWSHADVKLKEARF